MVATEEDREKALTEARAWILWGKPLDEAERRLRIAGFDREEAATFMRGVLEERAARFRRAGIRDALLGGGLFLACGILLVWCLTTTLVFRGAAWSGVGMVFGLVWLWRGMDRIHRGARTEGSITDL